MKLTPFSFFGTHNLNEADPFCSTNDALFEVGRRG